MFYSKLFTPFLVVEVADLGLRPLCFRIDFGAGDGAAAVSFAAFVVFSFFAGCGKLLSSSEVLPELALAARFFDFGGENGMISGDSLPSWLGLNVGSATGLRGFGKIGDGAGDSS